MYRQLALIVTLTLLFAVPVQAQPETEPPPPPPAPEAAEPGQPAAEPAKEEPAPEPKAEPAPAPEPAPEPAAEPAPEPAPVPVAENKPTVDWGYNKGFYAKTSDGKFSLKLGGWAMFMYTANWDDGDYKAGKAYVTKDDELTTNAFALRRARMLFKAKAFKIVDTFVLFEFMNELPMLDYRVTIQPIPEFGVRIGQQKTPLSRGFNMPPFKRAMISGSPALKYHLNWDMGVSFLGKFLDGMIKYHVGVFNGEGRNTKPTDESMLVVGRVEAHPLGESPFIETDLHHLDSPKLAIGFSTAYKPHYHSFGVGNVPFTEDITLEGDLTFMFKGFVLTSEVYYQTRRPDDRADINSLAWYIQASYAFWQSTMEAVVRGTHLKADLDKDGGNKVEGALGVNWYIWGYNLVAQAEYAFAHTQVPAPEDQKSHRFRLQVLTKF